MKKQAVISLSGGMDSTSVLMHLLSDNYFVTCIIINYGQKHNIEVTKALDLITYLSTKNISVKSHVIDLTSIAELLDSNLINGGLDIPTGHYDDNNMKQTVVPNRNKIFSSIIQSAALSLANKHNTEVIISMGIHAGDHTIYPDTTEKFINADYDAFVEGNWNSKSVTYYTPYMHFTKSEVLKDGIDSINKLKLDFKEIYSRTFTSYIPIIVKNETYSDYKSASSVERIEAFMDNNLIDPIKYSNGIDIVSWNVVCDSVKKTISSFKNDK